jgi:6-pyruvoyltetrahydropterin/6-carboxytetrahydropterin synthase
MAQAQRQQADHSVAAPLHITRAVRFCVNPPSCSVQGKPANTFAAAPTMAGLGAYYELRVTCAGEPDPRTGYLINIKDIDEAARRVMIPQLSRLCHEEPQPSAAEILRRLTPDLAEELPHRLVRIIWQLTPFFSITLEADSMSDVVMNQQFEFAASHRLHSPELTEEENRDLYGKCNNPAGHGHNYRLEVSARVPKDSRFTLPRLERLVDEHLVEKLDHKNLNSDVEELRGVIPSTENLARFCYEALSPRFEAEEASLQRVRLWETEKTSCTYPAE